MTGGTFGEGTPPTSLIGRDSELSSLRELVTPPYVRSTIRALLGAPGMGKTALLSEAVRTARSADVRVLQTAGRESEQDLAFAGLHQLLRPVLDRADGLAPRQTDALRGAFGLSAEPAPPDALLTGLAVLNLLAALSEDGPLLVVADDTQWLDQGSLDALTFAARRMDAEQIVVLLAMRGTVLPAGFQRDFPDPLILAPLSLQDAGRLLDAQPQPPYSRTRERVLSQAAGTPLALIELSKAAAADPGAGRGWAAEPLTVSCRLTEVMAARFSVLPADTRAALLLAAAADSPDLATSAVPGISADTLAPAERAGLIRMGAPAPEFTHPIVRAAVYQAAPFSERVTAHLAIADTLHSQPDRRAWHLASTVMAPDEQVALLLEDTAARAQKRGGAVAAARALERAAELSPDDEERARRLLWAARLALSAGQADWVHELSRKALTLTSSPERQITARLSMGWSLLWSRRNAEALDTLLAVASDVAPATPAIAWDAAGFAVTAAYQSGSPVALRRVREAIETLESLPPGEESAHPAEERPATQTDEYRIWIRACIDPFGDRAEAIPLLREVADGPVVDLGIVGAAAWILDESELAVSLLREALSRLRAPGIRGGSGAVLSALQWACIDSGRWNEALDAAREAADIAAAYKMETVASAADLAAAAVAALRGDHARVAPLLDRALAVVDPAEMRGFTARALQAGGLDALAQGGYTAAYTKFRRLFEEDGTPLHQHVSYLSMADLAAAAVRVERGREARELIQRALALVDPAPGPRLEQIRARALALTAEPAEAEERFFGAMANPVGGTWPFERAQLQLDYGEWLRRQRRVNDARPVLSDALETFRRLQATPWVLRAEGELRACGVSVQDRETGPKLLAGLTAQQSEIVRLASRGLSNPEIAERMFLSPRTVASHLYRSYPKLGVSGRHQLRDLFGPDPV
ncbi:AAA family ATPase [Streptomyces sp. NPDC059629]|uniref:helix-turn-helix transcriptional regulator n=1 Tax=Streptomyces sp. NPDC059629 TaxID=3346889 RepID=UPI00369C7DD6